MNRKKILNRPFEYPDLGLTIEDVVLELDGWAAHPAVSPSGDAGDGAS